MIHPTIITFQGEYDNNASLTLKEPLNIIENVSFHTKNDSPVTAIHINKKKIT